MYRFFGIILIILTACQSTTLEQQVIPVFDKYMKMDAQVNEVKYGDTNYIELQKTLRNYEFGEYTNALTLFSKNYCLNPNQKLLNKFIKVLINTEGSAYEVPSTILGEIYVCRPNTIIKVINNLTKKEKIYIVSSLYFGFQNVTYNKEKQIKNFMKLSEKLHQLKEENGTSYGKIK